MTDTGAGPIFSVRQRRRGTASAPFAVRQTTRASGNAYVVQVAGDYEDRSVTVARLPLAAVPIDPAEIRLADLAYVGPDPGHRDAVAGALAALQPSISRANIVVLLGDAGSGRRTAALRILTKLGLEPKRIHALEQDWDTPRVEQIPHLPGDGYILDLTAYQDLGDEFYTGLAGYQHAVLGQETFLVVLATAGTWHPNGRTRVPALAVPVPSAVAVATSHLRVLTDERVGWLNEHPLADVLGPRATPGEGARLAQAISQATDDQQGRRAAADEFQDWWNHLSKWFATSEHPGDLADRTLLIAAALLDGAPAAVIMDAADSLFTAVGGSLPTGGALAGRDLDRRLARIDASRDGDRVSLDSKRRGVDVAVLEYVWEQRPQLRSVLLGWASDISSAQGAAANHLERIAHALTRLAVASGGSQVLEVLTDWTDQGRSHHRFAVSMLGTLALDPTLGIAVRKNLYDWARQKGTSEDRARAVAEVCGGPLGQRYPRIALTRLRLLAARTDGRGGEAVATALRSLAARPQQCLLVLAEVLAWAESTDEQNSNAGAIAFLALVDLTALDSVGGLLAAELAREGTSSEAMHLFARGWHAARRHAPSSAGAMASLAAWLDVPDIPQEDRVDIAAAIVRERLGETDVAGMLLRGATTPSGETVRELALARLLYRMPEGSQDQEPAEAVPQHEQSDTAQEDPPSEDPADT
ncbi:MULTISPECIES: hypothetical protein [Streptacidiphilus]|uniref:LigA protein n=1 Tax=Streptacidiphilus cavernicola TaxID=3342716 RepID=A0ABV6V1J2_9ACTN|nr:hypothetical protein [Streptacidiphilus jeojiense]